MQAYYEIEAQIPSNHQFNIQLPDTIPVGRAKIAVTYELADRQQPTKNSLMAEFLNNLPEPKAQGLSREQIQTYMTAERASWDD